MLLVYVSIVLFLLFYSVFLLLVFKKLSVTASGSFLKRYPEESFVLLGGDSCMCAIAPEALPVGQDVEVEVGGIDDADPL